jgi:hypothetical protein
MTEEYRDRTLDSFVAAWVAPPPGSQFHSRVRRAFDREFVKEPWWRRWDDAFAWRLGKSLCGGGAIGASLLVTIGLAFPQTAGFNLPWLRPSLAMDIEEISYDGDGTRISDTYWRTVPVAGGHDRILWRYSPDHPYDNMLGRIVTQATYLLERITLPFFENTEETNVRADDRTAYVKSGCLRGDGTVSGHETLLGEEIIRGYSTTIIRWDTELRREGVTEWSAPGRVGAAAVPVRGTAWMAPVLGCRTLKYRIEVRRHDGTYHLIDERRVLEVTP